MFKTMTEHSHIDIKVGDILPTTMNMPMFKETTEYFDLESIFPKNKYLYTTEVVKAREFREEDKYWWSNNGKGFVTPYKRGDTMFGKRKKTFLNIEPGFVFIHPCSKFVSYIPEQIPLDNDFGFLIGIYLAEGLVTKTYVCISNKDKEVLKKIRHDI